MTADEGAWLLPSIGDLESTKTALDMVALSLTQRRPVGEPIGDVGLSTDQLMELAGVAVALSNLSAVLLLYIQGASAREGRPLSGLALLDTIRLHEQARADLASLDERGPFDEP